MVGQAKTAARDHAQRELRRTAVSTANTQAQKKGSRYLRHVSIDGVKIDTPCAAPTLALDHFFVELRAFARDEGISMRQMIAQSTMPVTA